MTADRLLQHLTGTRSTGRGTWIARCPAHDDKHPSLSIRETGRRQGPGQVLDRMLRRRGGRGGGPGAGRPLPRAPVASWEARATPVSGRRRTSGGGARSTIGRGFCLPPGNGGALTDDDRARLLLAAARIGAAVDESGYGAADLAAIRGNAYLDRITTRRGLEPRSGALGDVADGGEGRCQTANSTPPRLAIEAGAPSEDAVALAFVNAYGNEFRYVAPWSRGIAGTANAGARTRPGKCSR